MNIPQEELKNISFTDDIKHIYWTPNRSEQKNWQFDAWQDFSQHPCESPQRKFLQVKQKNSFSIKPFKIKKITSMEQEATSILKENKNNVTPIRKQKKQLDYQQQLMSQSAIQNTLQETPKKDINNPSFIRKFSRQSSRNSSKQKLAVSKFQKIGFFSQKIQKRGDSRQKNQQKVDQQNSLNFKIPLSAILYPVAKKTNRKTHRTMERFHSFVARSVRK